MVAGYGISESDDSQVSSSALEAVSSEQTTAPAQIALRLVGPHAHRLRDERDRRRQKQHERPFGEHLLREAQRRDCLARAACHDELAAVVLLEFLEAGVNGLALVRQGLLEQALADGLALNEGVPVHIGLCHAVGEKAHRAVLRGGLVQVRAEVLAGGDYHVVRVVVGCACLGVEGGDVSEVERRLLVALALDGPIRAVLRVLGDKVDSQVCAVVCGRVLPHPHVAEALRVNRVVHEVVPAGALELVSLVALRFAGVANPVDYLVYGSRALVRPVDRGSSHARGV